MIVRKGSSPTVGEIELSRLIFDLSHFPAFDIDTEENVALNTSSHAGSSPLSSQRNKKKRDKKEAKRLDFQIRLFTQQVHGKLDKR